MSITALSSASGINRAHLSRVVNGRIPKPTLDTLRKLRVALKLDSVESVEHWLKHLRVAGAITDSLE
jgi:transcriptional regulator with XRE-family HTH domain